ncbi:hypothetical protein OE88DRAFT_1722777 [Heliocybe sulcata]|uniref:Zn(2)-C6 fungal-type domain-containing protein n=1 Tax=Heliocybe sulcata TaxID=5364 RepID=A0A5C3NI45_9AGAM|nr:hypothetical protein OE88DRAFT_1722777 [Heliocybe sulcata]
MPSPEERSLPSSSDAHIPIPRLSPGDHYVIPNRRPKAPAACDRCRTRKAKCEPTGLSSGCKKCTEKSLRCNFSPQKKRKKRSAHAASSIRQSGQPTAPESPAMLPSMTPHGSYGVRLDPLDPPHTLPPSSLALGAGPSLPPYNPGAPPTLSANTYFLQPRDVTPPTRSQYAYGISAQANVDQFGITPTPDAAYPSFAPSAEWLDCLPYYAQSLSYPFDPSCSGSSGLQR